ncbi:6-pyruvoyltetrahydropterin/6-carboxytetrahydropt erin synthase [Thermodesulfobium acidiphilum]|uniref:6-carboxy-5,6,7,8-tetrahydropterin synthase n=1 Tax=Thermodesulfobium acidiphilum TaxID=1794699 RepID=A0A2R4W245_THEAF|nr:6-carboxytetrahydropterin synthase QueD [Thermodesulfobium acidiphilum]AWB10790.1 6-pyruvoyltetrahydropterin/6-carboxytetrahydropt erin synthase [Thermodesulfobium acidiphilum]
MRIKVYKEFNFSAAHKLVDYNGECANLHGHTYKLGVAVSGSVGENSMVIDFKVLKNIVEERVVSKLDHKYLNDIIHNPTAERVCEWILDELKDYMPESVNLEFIRLWESETSYVEISLK